MKSVKINREVTEDVVKVLEHALELARMGEIIGIVGALRMKNSYTRKIVHGEYIKDIPRAIGELETLKMWLFGGLKPHYAPPRKDELKELREKIKKEK